MFRLAALAAFGLLSTAVPAAESPTADPPAPAEAQAASTGELLLTDTYPIEVSVSMHKGLLHWMDSLANLKGAGLTGGKTVRAHQIQYDRVHGKPTARDVEMLTTFHTTRRSYVRKAPADERSRLTLAFFAATDLDEALRATGELLDEREAKAFAESVRYFVPRYKAIWREGLVPNEFLERVAASEQRDAVAEFLAGVARFFGVPPTQQPRPHLVLVPTPSGTGTHAQAIGHYLLVEIRRGESLTDEVTPIVHENVHLLHARVDPSKMDRMRAAVLAGKPQADDAEHQLREALPTAIAQGVAGEAFQKGRWSREDGWYHIAAVDDYAKRIFPIVKKALTEGRVFDEAFLREVIAAYDP